MSKSFIESNDILFGAQLRNFYNKLLIYAISLGFIVRELDALKKDCDAWDYCMKVNTSIQMFAQDYTKFKLLLRKGNKNEFVTDFPILSEFGEIPAVVAANIQLRFRQAAGKAKNSANYTKAIGKDLGIEPVQQTFDPTTGKPTLKIKINANRPILSFVKNKYKGLIIYKDEGDGYVYLTTALKCKYNDMSALPEPNTSAIWKYKAIYVWDGNEAGHWSDEITIVVRG